MESITNFAQNDTWLLLSPRERQRAFRERRARLSAYGVQDRGIACLSASERSAAFIHLPALLTEGQLAAAEAAFCFKDWLKRQDDLHPLPAKDLWFEIVDEIEPQAPRLPRIEDIQNIVAQAYGVRRIDINSARRTANVVRPRQVAMYLAKTLTLRSLPEIGRRFGGRDHTTVLHAVRKIEALVAKDIALSEEVESLKRQLQE